MDLHSDLRVLTIVAEAVIESRLLHELEMCGARGWTVTDARGRGPRDRRTGDIAGGNVRIETVVTPEVMQRVVDRLKVDYFPSYACVAWATPVIVSRVDHFA